MIYNENIITGIYYSGYTIVRAYGCGGELVFGEEPISNYKVRVSYKTSSYDPSQVGQVDCDDSPILTNQEMKDDITFPTYFTAIKFGDCITTIGEDAFINVGTISSVTIPSNIITLESCAFNNCGIQNYVLNEGLITIGHTAFINNYNLTSITIPASVTSIGSQAFYNCTGLTSVTFIGTTPPQVDYTIFYGCGNLNAIYVPSASVDAYKVVFGNLADLVQPVQL